MTLDQLRIFIAVAERQHVTRAAEALNIAQSAASASIATLEAQHHAKLFHRLGRGIELTESGSLFLIEAKAVVARVERAELVLSELSGLKTGTLSLFASQTIASYWLPRHLVRFRRAHPGIAIRLDVGNTAQAAAAVHDGLAELGFVEGVVDDESLVATEMARDQLVVVVAPDHSWSELRAVTGPQLVETAWVLREPGSGTRSEFEASLEAFGLTPRDLNVVLELPTNESVRAAVEAGLGATALSASVAAPSLEAGLLHQIQVPLSDRAFSVMRHVDRYHSVAADRLLELIRGP